MNDYNDLYDAMLQERARAEKAEAAIAEHLDGCKELWGWKPDDLAGSLTAMQEYGDCAAVVKAELARLTTLRPASEHDGKTQVIEWFYSGKDRRWKSLRTCYYVNKDHRWTPLPEPKEEEK